MNRKLGHVPGLPDNRDRDCRWCQKAALYGDLLKSRQCPKMHTIVRECPLLAVNTKDEEVKPDA